MKRTLKEKRAIQAKFPQCPKCEKDMLVYCTRESDVLSTWFLKCSDEECEGRSHHDEHKSIPVLESSTKMFSL